MYVSLVQCYYNVNESLGKLGNYRVIIDKYATAVPKLILECCCKHVTKWMLTGIQHSFQQVT